MSQSFKLTIADDLAARIEERRGDRTVQEYTLDALRALINGTPVEAELRAEVERLHHTLRAFAHAQDAIRPDLPSPTEASPGESQTQPKKLSWG
jgi:hypothetical protein